MPKHPPDLSIVTLTWPEQVTGPIRFDWLEAAARVAGRSKALHTASAIAWLAALHARPDVTLTRRSMARWGLSRDSAGDTLRLLQKHQLLLVWSAPGRARRVVLTEPGTNTPLAIG